MNQLDKIFEACISPEDYSRRYFEYLGEILAAISTREIATFIELLINAREMGNQIIFMGNGGSAATASHFANDLGIGTRTFKNPFRAVSITDNSAIISAVANDDGYDAIFEQQLMLLMRPSDIVVAISASGNSPNLIKAIEYANQEGATTVGLTAFDGGKLKQKAQYSVHVPTNMKEYGPAEDAHMILDHLIGTYLSRLVMRNG